MIRERVDALIEREFGALVALRRHLHMYPELSRGETATTDRLIGELRTRGWEPARLAVGTGLVCDIGPVGAARVALRADIDALAMPDGTTTPYRSRVEGVSHACGHDAHTAMVLGAGIVLDTILRESPIPGGGGVRLLFEPCEERSPSGAIDIVAEGWLEGVAAVFGLHCDPKLDVGHLGCRPGAITSASGTLLITVNGPGGHTARPHLGVDLVAALGRVATGLQQAIDTQTGAVGLLRVSFGAVHAGDAANVIPATGTLSGTVRTQDRGLWRDARPVIEAAVAQALLGTSATWELDYRPGVPPVINDPFLTDILAAAGTTALGPGGVVTAEHSLGADSFAWFLDSVPGSFGRIGVHDPGSAHRVDLHSSDFDLDERAIRHGVAVLVHGALGALDHLSRQ